MATSTTNLSLSKPELSDTSDITTQNGNWDILDTKVYNSELKSRFFDTSGTDTYTVTTGWFAYVDGETLKCNFLTVNTGASTIAPDGLTAKAIKISDGTADVAAGDLDGYTILIWDAGNDFFVLAPKGGADINKGTPYIVSPTNAVTKSEQLSITNKGLFKGIHNLGNNFYAFEIDGIRYPTTGSYESFKQGYHEFNIPYTTSFKFYSDTANYVINYDIDDVPYIEESSSTSIASDLVVNVTGKGKLNTVRSDYATIEIDGVEIMGTVGGNGSLIGSAPFNVNAKFKTSLKVYVKGTTESFVSYKVE